MESVGCGGFLHDAVVVEDGAEFHESDDVGVQTASSDLVSSWFGHVGHAEAGDERTHHHHTTTQARSLLDEILGLEIVEVDLAGLQADFVGSVAAYLDAHAFEQVDEVVDVEDVGKVLDDDFLAGEQAGADDLHGLVLGALRHNLAFELVTSFNTE